jgi:hypothetical protein
MGYAVGTYDADYLALAASGANLAGAIFDQQDRHRIGERVRALQALHARSTAEAFINRVEDLQRRQRPGREAVGEPGAPAVSAH